MTLSFLKLKPVVIGLIVTTLLLLVLQAFQNKTVVPQIISTTPSDGAIKQPLQTTPLIVFDSPISLEDIKIKSNPSIQLAPSLVNENSIQLSHSLDFQPATKYSITVMWKDQTLPPLSFTTITTQTDPALLDQMQTELLRDYPLGQKTPYTTSLYRVVYSAPLTLEITIRNPNIPSQEIIDEVKAWVTKNGGDASAHKYVIATPTTSAQPDSGPAQLDSSPLGN